MKLKPSTGHNITFHILSLAWTRLHRPVLALDTCSVIRVGTMGLDLFTWALAVGSGHMFCDPGGHRGLELNREMTMHICRLGFSVLNAWTA